MALKVHYQNPCIEWFSTECSKTISKQITQSQLDFSAISNCSKTKTKVIAWITFDTQSKTAISFDIKPLGNFLSNTKINIVFLQSLIQKVATKCQNIELSVAFQGNFTGGYNYSDRQRCLPQSLCLFSFFSAECTIGMVRGLTPLKHYGAISLWQ